MGVGNGSVPGNERAGFHIDSKFVCLFDGCCSGCCLRSKETCDAICARFSHSDRFVQFDGFAGAGVAAREPSASPKRRSRPQSIMICGRGVRIRFRSKSFVRANAAPRGADIVQMRTGGIVHATGDPALEGLTGGGFWQPWFAIGFGQARRGRMRVIGGRCGFMTHVDFGVGAGSSHIVFNVHSFFSIFTICASLSFINVASFGNSVQGLSVCGCKPFVQHWVRMGRCFYFRRLRCMCINSKDKLQSTARCGMHGRLCLTILGRQHCLTAGLQRGAHTSQRFCKRASRHDNTSNSTLFMFICDFRSPTAPKSELHGKRWVC